MLAWAAATRVGWCMMLAWGHVVVVVCCCGEWLSGDGERAQPRASSDRVSISRTRTKLP